MPEKRLVKIAFVGRLSRKTALRQELPGASKEPKDLQGGLRKEAGKVGRGHVNQFGFSFKLMGYH